MSSTVLNQSLIQSIKAAAEQLGFGLLGVCPAVQPRGLAHFDEWLAAGHAGDMRYLPQRRAAYTHPDSVLSGVRSIVMLALDYRTLEPSAPQSGRGRVSRYAWGVDYHAVIHDKLEALCASPLGLCPEARVRGVVDTAPLLERELAELAGLGWIGKNTLLLNA